MEPKKNESQHKYKIMLLGNMAVGKSSIMYRYTEDNFNVNIMGTAGIDIRKKIIRLNDTEMNLMIYDTAGHDRFRQITKSQYKGARGIIVIYDVTDRKAFESVTDWMDHIKTNADSDVEIVLVGNKIDMTNRAISEEEGKELAKKYNVPFIETSALTGYNIEKTFTTLVQNIIDKEMKKIIITSEVSNKPTEPKKDKNNACCAII
jgi:small GTP-binding protein